VGVLDDESWRAVLTLEEEVGEYWYPAVIQSTDEMIHIVYTWNSSRIKHAIIDPKEIK